MQRKVKCPTCRKPVVWQGNPYRPFCSERCRLIDVGAWANESYRIPGEHVTDTVVEHKEDEPATTQPSLPHAHTPNRTR
jgi:endogenous inhibitor of DNA gyrase (YacG/DUF329 family)